MSVASVTEIITSSEKSAEDAVKQGVKRAGVLLRNIESTWVKDTKVTIVGNKVKEFKVILKVRFSLDS